MAPSTAEDDAASEALIARLIAEDLGVNFDAWRIGGSVEDYEEPLSSYERGLLEDPDNVNNGDDSTSWGDPTVINPGEGDSSTEPVPREPTGEGWDAGVASGFDDDGIPDTTASEHGEQEKQDDIDYKGRSTSHDLSDEIYTHSDAEMHGLTQTVSVPGHVPCQPVEEPRTNISDLEANVTNIASLPTQPDSSPGKQYIGYIGPAETHVPPRPPTPLDSRRKGSDPPCLETTSSGTSNPPSPTPRPTHMVPMPEDIEGKHPSNHPELTAPPRSPKCTPTRLTDQDSRGLAIIWPQPTRRDSTSKPVEWAAPPAMPRPSAFDRYAGLDIDYSSSKGKGKAWAFDNFDDDEDDYDEEYETFLKENLRKKLGFGDGYEVDEDGDSCSSWIYIPFPGTRGGEFGELDARMEDNDVVEIRVGDDETLESILSDICNSKSPDGTDLASTVGTESVPLSSTQPSSVQGKRDEESTSEPDKTPEIQTLRQAKRKSWYRRKSGNNPRLKDQELLYGKSLRPDHEVLEGMPKLGRSEDEKVVETPEEKPDKTPEPRTLRGARRMARLRRAMRKTSKLEDKGLLDDKPARSEHKALKGWWRWGHGEEVKEDDEIPRGRPVKREEVDTLEDLPKQAESEDEEPRGRPVKRIGEKNQRGKRGGATCVKNGNDNADESESDTTAEQTVEEAAQSGIEALELD